MRAWNGEESSHAQSQQATAAAADVGEGGGGGGEVGRRTIFLSFFPGTGTRYLPPILMRGTPYGEGGRRTRARAFVIHNISLEECSLWGSMPKGKAMEGFKKGHSLSPLPPAVPPKKQRELGLASTNGYRAYKVRTAAYPPTV